MGFNSILKLVTQQANAHNLHVGKFFRNVDSHKYEIMLVDKRIPAAVELKGQTEMIYTFEIPYPNIYGQKQAINKLIKEETKKARDVITVADRLSGIRQDFHKYYIDRGKTTGYEDITLQHQAWDV